MKEYSSRVVWATHLIAALVATVFLLAGCAEPEEALRVAPAESHRDYVFGLNSHQLSATGAGARWLDASVRVFSDSTRVMPPFVETLHLDPLTIPVVGYEFPGTLGQRIDIEVDTELEGYFVDVFLLEGERSGRLVSTNPRYPEALYSWVADSSHFSFEPAENGRYLLRIQPRLLEGGEMTVSILPDAALEWPVPGTDQRQIWSYFGAPRAGGARVHHGIDIFAPRGTPLVAVSSAEVMRVGERQLGGNIVTLSDEKRGLRIYYAHLDEQLVEEGRRVETGNVIGTVGNTGNALFTPPHLHIGIYQAHWRRPVDPWYFFVAPDRTTSPPGPLDYQVGSWLRTTTEVEPVRYPAARSGVTQSPARFDAIGEPVDAEQVAPSAQPVGRPVSRPLSSGTALRLMGARRGYYRVALPTGEQGYVPRHTVTAALDPLEVVVATELLPAYVNPDVTSDVTAQFSPGQEVAVLARFGERYGLVLRRSGRAAWIDLAHSRLSG